MAAHPLASEVQKLRDQLEDLQRKHGRGPAMERNFRAPLCANSKLILSQNSLTSQRKSVI